MNRIYSNTNSRNDHLFKALRQYGKDADISIAVAFFTDHKEVEQLVENGCKVNLIVRLGFPTSARSLEKVLGLNNVYVRYFTGSDFHPKLYIFGHRLAVVGSSNLTSSGLSTNQELNIAVESEDPIFEDLEEIFAEYWDVARPLTDDVVARYGQIVASMDSQQAASDRQIQNEIGRVVFPNIARGKQTKNASQYRKDKLLKRYQRFLGEFRNLREIYESTGRRVVPEEVLPLRIEIDQFLHWIRATRATKDIIDQAPLRRGEELRAFVLANIEEFMSVNFPAVEKVTEDKYPVIREKCQTSKVINAWSESDIEEVVSVVNAFSSRDRWYVTHEAHFQKFLEENGIENIRKSFNYLLFGKGEFTERIARCVLDDDLKLANFGDSSVQELYGWANGDDVPICNEKTFEAMQWLGFGAL